VRRAEGAGRARRVGKQCRRGKWRRIWGGSKIRRCEAIREGQVNTRWVRRSVSGGGGRGGREIVKALPREPWRGGRKVRELEGREGRGAETQREPSNSTY